MIRLIEPEDRRTPPSAAFFTARHDGCMKSVAKAFGHFVNLVRTINLDRLAGGIEDDLAVAAFLQMLLHSGAGFDSNRVVDQIVEEGKKLSAGQDATSTARGIEMGKTMFIAAVRPSLILRASFLLRPALWTPLSF